MLSNVSVQAYQSLSEIWVYKFSITELIDLMCSGKQLELSENYGLSACIHLGLCAEKLLEVLQGFAVILYHICSRSWINIAPSWTAAIADPTHHCFVAIPFYAMMFFKVWHVGWPLLPAVLVPGSVSAWGCFAAHMLSIPKLSLAGDFRHWHTRAACCDFWNRSCPWCSHTILKAHRIERMGKFY
jgi:hypothetical protein